MRVLTHQRSLAWGAALPALAVSLLLGATPAQAQENAQAEVSAEPAGADEGFPPAAEGEIVVTGSRIARRDFQANSPLVTVGEEALAYTTSFEGEIHSVASPEEAGALLEELAAPGDRVLVKGSRSAGLERVLAAA